MGMRKNWGHEWNHHRFQVKLYNVVGWRLINDRQLFGYFYTFILSCLVGWGVVRWGGIITSCLSAFHTYLPHGRHCLLGGVRRGGVGWGGVGWDINVIFIRVLEINFQDALDATLFTSSSIFQDALDATEETETPCSPSHSLRQNLCQNIALHSSSFVPGRWHTMHWSPLAQSQRIYWPCFPSQNEGTIWFKASHRGQCACEAMVVQNVV